MFAVWYSVVLVLLHQARGITASSVWPEGIYGLPKPKTGCPEEWKNNGWIEYGKISQKTSVTNRLPNTKSIDLQMIANVDARLVEIYFCISKATGSSSDTRPTWPKGEYCIYSKHSIKGMRSGNIRMKDWYSEFSASNTHNSFFESNWYEYTVYFRCQTRGNKKIPISLPITKPFYLLPYGSRDCQQVKWMVATSEWIKDYTYGTRYRSRTRPYCEYRSSKDELTMYYCYYKSCNYTLNDTRGVFHSPGFPVKYSDGQLCSWRIMVPDNHTLVVNFTNFSLYEYDKDCLQLYENNGGTLEPRESFFGYKRPRTITATKNVTFVFRSDEENNSAGFRAEYEIFRTPERTTTSKPPTTTTHPTTTTKPTTKLTTTQPPPTTLPTTKRQILTEAPTTTINMNSTINKTSQCKPTPTKDKSYNERHINPLLKKTCFCDETWRIVVMVIPLAVFILIILVIIDIFCRCRYKKALKSGANGLSTNDGMVINPTYERGNIILEQPSGNTTDTSTVNTADDHPQSRDDPPDYEDVDYTQLNEVPPSKKSAKRRECHELEPIGNDTSSVFYHVLEPLETESDQPQSHVDAPVGNGAPEVFYHTLEPPTDLDRPTYQNLSEVNHYTLNPIYESSENSAPLVEANKLYDNCTA